MVRCNKNGAPDFSTISGSPEMYKRLAYQGRSLQDNERQNYNRQPPKKGRHYRGSRNSSKHHVFVLLITKKILLNNESASLCRYKLIMIMER